MEHRRWRILAAERTVVANVGPDATCDGLELCQHRHRRVIRMNALCAQNIVANGLNDRVERDHTGADPIGKRRLIDLHALARVSLALAIERQMQQELGDQHHREQTWSRKPAGNRTGWRRWLGDRLAIPTRELLAHVLDDLPAPRFAFQRLRYHFTELAQPDASVSSTMRALSSRDQRRRRSTPSRTSTRIARP